MSTNTATPATHDTLKHAAKCLSAYASAMLCAAASTMLIERGLQRLSAAWDVKAEFSILPTNLVLNVWDKQGEHSYSCISATAGAGINLTTITALNSLSERVLSQDMSIEDTQSAIDEILSRPPLSDFWIRLLASAANASFCRLFEGDWAAIAIVFVATFAGFYVKQRLHHWKWDYRALTILSGMTASVISCSGFVFGWTDTPETALATSVLYLVPGIPFCNSVSDLFYGHYVCAMSRFLRATMLTMSLSIGLCLALLLLGISMI